MRQARNNMAGLAAEETVLRHYMAAGYAVLARRYRGTRGEIDLVLGRGGDVVFIEVKKSRSFGAAVARLGATQIRRIVATAAEFLSTQPMGQMTETRFDVALVNAHGDVSVIENALWQ